MTVWPQDKTVGDKAGEGVGQIAFRGGSTTIAVIIQLCRLSSHTGQCVLNLALDGRMEKT